MKSSSNYLVWHRIRIMLCYSFTCILCNEEFVNKVKLHGVPIITRKFQSDVVEIIIIV